MFRHADVVCLCLVCILWQFSILHDLQFVNAGRGWKRHTPEPVCLPHPVAVSAFINCSGLCACTEML